LTDHRVIVDNEDTRGVAAHIGSLRGLAA
jgi:hypothetical protein